MPTLSGCSMRVAVFAAAAACALLRTVPVWAQQEPGMDRRIVRHNPAVDADFNLVHDLLDQHLSDGTVRLLNAVHTQGVTPGQPLADLIICLDHAPTAEDVAAVQAAGGVVVWTMGHEPDGLLFAMRVGWPVTVGSSADMVHLQQTIPGVVWVEANIEAELTMLFSTKQTGARRSWSADGLRGRSDRTVVIMDTGLDDSHTDLAGRIVAWLDATGDAAAAPRDPQHHGTHVAGTAVGTGAVGGLTSGTGQIPYSETQNFTGQAGNTFLSFFPIDTTGYGAPAAVQLNLRWANTGGAGTVTLHLIRYDGTNFVSHASITANMTDAQPLVLNATIPAGLVDVDWSAGATRSDAGDSTKYWVQVKAPHTAAGDGFDLNSGLAPLASMAGVRIFNDAGSGSGESAILSAIDWINTNRKTHKFIVVNNSWSFTNTIVPSVDTAFNNLVLNGVVVEGSAGNGRQPLPPSDSTDKVGSPASTSAAIATAALNANDAITWYSSYGSTSLSQSKPDVAAPGGSSQAQGSDAVGRFIGSVDSNDADEQRVAPDRFSNDYVYRGWQGTSMSGPHVSGAAALVAQAIEEVYGSWSWDSPAAAGFSNRVKMFLGMTATETNQSAEDIGPHPTLDRGAKDISEGFGRINVDAAVETVRRGYLLGLSMTETFGNSSLDRKAWGRRIELKGGIQRTFTLDVPPGADFDLYLYRDAWTNDGTTSSGSIGDPIIELKSTTAGGGVDESITFTPPADGRWFIVVKRVSGAGSFILKSVAPTFTCGGPAAGAFVSHALPSPSAVPQPVTATVPVRVQAAMPQPGCGG